MTFAERYRQALAFKSLDVEEVIDRRFHRPIAAVLAAALLPLGVRPNQVTLASLLTGWTGAYLLYRGFYVGDPGPPLIWLLSGFFLFLSVILDCADGQLARARGGGSRVGRILDGFVDVLVLFPTYVILGIGIGHLFGTTWILIAAIAGFSTWIRCIVYDKTKNLYLANTMPSAGGAEGTESLTEVRKEQQEARRSGTLLERFLLWVYVGYLQVQERFASGSTEKQTHHLSPEDIQAYRATHRPTMRLAAAMGLGTHMALLYTSIALMALDLRAALAIQVLLATVFNALLVLAILRTRTLSRP